MVHPVEMDHLRLDHNWFLRGLSQDVGRGAPQDIAFFSVTPLQYQGRRNVICQACR